MNIYAVHVLMAAIDLSLSWQEESSWIRGLSETFTHPTEYLLWDFWNNFDAISSWSLVCKNYIFLYTKEVLKKGIDLFSTALFTYY